MRGLPTQTAPPVMSASIKRTADDDVFGLFGPPVALQSEPLQTAPPVLPINARHSSAPSQQSSKQKPSRGGHSRSLSTPQKRGLLEAPKSSGRRRRRPSNESVY